MCFSLNTEDSRLLSGAGDRPGPALVCSFSGRKTRCLDPVQLEGRCKMTGSGCDAVQRRGGADGYRVTGPGLGVWGACGKKVLC